MKHITLYENFSTTSEILKKHKYYIDADPEYKAELELIDLLKSKPGLTNIASTPEALYIEVRDDFPTEIIPSKINNKNIIIHKL